jgi:hypothetical protein
LTAEASIVSIGGDRREFFERRQQRLAQRRHRLVELALAAELLVPDG